MNDNLSADIDINDEKVLKDFLLDIDCLNKLNPWTNKFNLFDVLKISRTEIRHSNLLGWLLDPNENHNLKDYFIRGLIEKTIKNIDGNSDINIFNILLMNFYEFKVLRERNNIDLLLVADESKVLICIENKVYSSEHSNQLKRYKEIIDNDYKDYKKIYLYLTPTGEDSSDVENWISISYSDLIEILIASTEKTSLLPDVELLLENYIETVRWHIVGDDKLMKICNEIYKKHKKALDLIYENKADNSQEISNFIIEHVKSSKQDNFELNIDKSGKSYIRFTSTIMDKILKKQDTETSGWKTSNYYFYEITNRGNTLKLQHSISKGNFTDEERDNYFEKILKTFPNDKKLNWTWKILKSWPILKYTDDKTVDDIEDNLVQKLDEIFDKLSEYEKGVEIKVNQQDLLSI